jgi:hypothetical protein
MQTVTAKLYPGSGVDLFSKGKAQMFWQGKSRCTPCPVDIFLIRWKNHNFLVYCVVHGLDAGSPYQSSTTAYSTTEILIFQIFFLLATKAKRAMNGHLSF